MSREGQHSVEVHSSGFSEVRREPSEGFGSGDEEKNQVSDVDETSLLLENDADHQIPLTHSASWMAVASACAYALVGLLMGFFNKAVLVDWPYPNSFLALQMGVSIIIVYVMKAWGLTTVKPLQVNSAKSLLPVVFFYNTNVAFALAAVRALSIPVYHVLKRLTPVMVLVGKFLIGGNPPSKEITLSVLTVVSGCLMAGFGDLSFDLSGYSAALMSCALQSTYLILVERSGSEKGFNSMELLLYNGILSLPVLLAIILGTGEVWESVQSIKTQFAETVLFLPLLISTLLMGSLLNYCLFLCTLCNSALTTTIVGTLRSVFGTAMGFFVFGGVKGTVFMFLGVTFNTIGGVWYTVIKHKEKQAKVSQDTLSVKPEKQNNFKAG